MLNTSHLYYISMVAFCGLLTYFWQTEMRQLPVNRAIILAVMASLISAAVLYFRNRAK
jgi:hypothetical protein